MAPGIFLETYLSLRHSHSTILVAWADRLVTGVTPEAWFPVILGLALAAVYHGLPYLSY